MYSAAAKGCPSGFRRVRDPGGGWAYRRGADDSPVRSRGVVARLRRVRVPPAYTDVCYSADPAAALQATGTDERGRRQYVYSRAHREAAAASKFARMARFGRALPDIRRAVRRMLAADEPRLRRRGLALALVDRCRLRPGAPEYVRANGTHGAATLRRRHVRVTGGGQGLRIAFRGKRRIRNECVIPRDAGLVAAARSLLRADEGLASPRDLNAALPDGMFVKDIRTWGANVEFLKAALARPGAATRELVADTARKLHNTPRVCRRSYVLPALLAWASETRGVAGRGLPSRAEPLTPGLSSNESRLLRFLESPRGDVPAAAAATA